MKDLAIALSACAALAACDSTSAPTPRSQADPGEPSALGQPVTTSTAPTPGAPGASAANPPPSVSVSGVGSCEASGELSALVTRWTELADADQNGKISREEAQSFSNFLIGGLFFRTDADGDGVVSPEEGRAARSELASRHPAVATLLSQTRALSGESPFKLLAELAAVDYGKPLSAEQAREAARDALDGLFSLVDEDRSGQITLVEARAASWRGVGALGQQVFQAVDHDGNGRLELAEFQRAVNGTAARAFEAGDSDDDGSLTREEATLALGGVAHRLGLPAPAGGQR